MARLVFLGRLADLAGSPEREVAPGPLADVLAAMPRDLAVALLDERVRIALNGALVTGGEAVVLAGGDELAFLPPVSGG
ncbi:MAG: MoaD/ThiS family protein [Proteobacteria bacterium]|nr:MoaD/ThiS family protein [Pseudomonadota bacterium]